MSLQSMKVLIGLHFFVGILGAGVFFFGVFSALWPRRSIGLYEWLMARINWRVVPIDEAREVRTTRLLGIALIVAGLALGILLFQARI